MACRACKGGYSPAINSYTHECIMCNNSKALKNSMKYIGTVYVPLVLLFFIIIVFNIHLTTGPANALFCIALTAGGQINYPPVATVAIVYRTIDGILNLEFFLNLLDPFCLSTSLDTLDLILLNYIVAVFPLVTISCLWHLAPYHNTATAVECYVVDRG